MDYFFVQQDSRLMRFKSSSTRDGQTVLSAQDNAYMDYPDWITTDQEVIATSKLTHILEKYEPTIQFSAVSLMEKAGEGHMTYYRMKLPSVKCASQKSEFDRAGNVKKFVLDEDLAEGRRIFQALDYRNGVLVRLDVAESLLRRDLYGLTFEMVERE